MPCGPVQPQVVSDNVAEACNALGKGVKHLNKDQRCKVIIRLFNFLDNLLLYNKTKYC